MSVQPLLTPLRMGESGSTQSHCLGTAHPHARWVDGITLPTTLQAEYYAVAGFLARLIDLAEATASQC